MTTPRTADIETFQARWELDEFVSLVEGYEPRTILEIGCWDGGTLWHWIDLPLTETVVAIDDGMRRLMEWHTWADEADVDLHTLQGRSQEPFVVEQAAAHGPYDLIFIDGDHTADAVTADWQNYSPMLADGGMIAFHDILPRPEYGVSEVWQLVKWHHASRWVEICQRAVEPGNEGTCGIGVAWL